MGTVDALWHVHQLMLDLVGDETLSREAAIALEKAHYDLMDALRAEMNQAQEREELV